MFPKRYTVLGGWYDWCVSNLHFVYIYSYEHYKLQNFEKLGLTFLAKNSKKDTHQSRLLDVGNEKSFKIKLFQKIQCQFQKYQNIESLKWPQDLTIGIKSNVYRWKTKHQKKLKPGLEKNINLQNLPQKDCMGCHLIVVIVLCFFINLKFKYLENHNRVLTKNWLMSKIELAPLTRGKKLN